MRGLAVELDRKGCAVSVYADHFVAQGATERAFDTRQRFSVRRYGGIKPLRRRRKAAHIAVRLSGEPVDALLMDSWKSLEFLPDRAAPRILCLAHGMEYPHHPGRIRRRSTRRSLAKATDIIANSSYTAARLRESSGWQGDNVHVIPPAIPPPSPPDPALLAAFRARHVGRTPQLLSVGRLVPYKGYQSVLQAVSELVQDWPGLLYHIAGAGPQRHALGRLVDALGLGRHVVFHGTVDPVRRGVLLALADVFALPGCQDRDDAEGFGIVFLEAAAMGVPALAGRFGGAADAVLDGQTGFLCRGEDPADVGLRLRQLLSQPTLRQQFAVNARRHARRFYWDSVIGEYLALLRRDCAS